MEKVDPLKTLTPPIGILLITVEGKGNNWSAQGGNQWHVSDNPNYNPQTINHINQNGPGRVNTDNEETAQYGQGRAWTPPENHGWGLQNIYGQNTKDLRMAFNNSHLPRLDCR
ncbi:hypothetical protein CEXT_195451 [Caerostris extrusa]|uniref:Uncharacterized protein n=1 Tax=Caerostris extrusa TaxID=172846 RepID=A0AAV4UYH3_CAEEX|nr:hypothetical protein CEXT_195451 [Caerostris extrusa]